MGMAQIIRESAEKYRGGATIRDYVSVHSGIRVPVVLLSGGVVMNSGICDFFAIRGTGIFSLSLSFLLSFLFLSGLYSM